MLSTELSMGEGTGPFEALGNAAGANLFTGDANVSIPIQNPPGRGQATPALSLAYSSSGRDGLFGSGWSLGLGSVMRSTRRGAPTCVEDQEFTLSIPGASVELVHDAQEGVYYAKVDEAYIEAIADPIDNEWTVHDRAGRTYRFGQDATARAWAGGDVFMDPVGCAFTAAWALTQVEDPNGNTIDFVYTNTGNSPLIAEIRYGANPAAGLVEHPFKVEFQLRDPPRMYPQQFHSLGVPQVMSELVSQIDVYYRDGVGGSYQLDRSYVLEYTEKYVSGFTEIPYGGRALLESVSATGLPTRTFSYVLPTLDHRHDETRPVPFSNDDALFLSRATDGNTLFRLRNGTLDMNGDGIIDAVDTNPQDASAWLVYLGTPSGFEAAPIAWDVTELPIDNREAIRETKRQSGRNDTWIDTLDINSDGVPDWVDARSSSGWTVFPGTCTSATVCKFLPGIPWSAPDQYLGVVQLTGDGSEVRRALIDLNGDAFPDYVDVTGSSAPWSVHLGTGSGFAAIATDFDATGWLGVAGSVDWSLGYMATKRRVFDMNGDGLPDLVSVDDSWTWLLNPSTGELSQGSCDPGCAPTNVLEVRLNTGSSFGPPVLSSLGSHYKGYLTFEHQRQEAGWISAGFTLCQGNSVCHEYTEVDMIDVNGDGLPDLVDMHQGALGVPRVVLNVGGGRLEMGPGTFVVEGGSSPSIPPILSSTRTIKGLGTTVGISSVPLRWRVSEETGGTKETRGLVDIVDLNGDGLWEIVVVDSTSGAWKSSSVAASPDLIQPSGLLLEAENGVGGVTAFRYASSTLYDNSGSDGVPDLPFPKWLTTAIRQTDGLCTPDPLSDPFDPQNPCLVAGHERLRRFDYAGGLFDAAEREFRGFGTVIETDADGNHTEATFSQADYTRGKVLSQVVRAVDGGGASHDVRIVNNVWQAIESALHPDRTQVYLAEARSEERGVPDVASERMCSISRNEEPDEYGRVSLTCTYECGVVPAGVCAPAPGQTVTETQWATPSVGSYVRERPAEVEVSYVDGSMTSIILSKKRMRYDGQTGSPPLNEGLVDKGNVRWVESWLDQSVIDPAYPGWTPAIRMEYDAYGNLTSTTDERGETRTSVFDPSLFSLHPVMQIAPSTGGVPHETHIVTNLRFGKPVAVTDENGGLTEVLYDDLGRMTCEARPGESIQLCHDLPSVVQVSREIDYSFGDPGATSFEGRLTKIETRIFNATNGFNSSTSFFDALGRQRFTKVERTIGTDDPSSTPQTVIEGQVELDSEGRVIRQFAPYVANAAMEDPASASVPATLLTYQLNGTGPKDPLGRVHTLDPPGSEQVVSTYRGRFTESQDASGARSVTERDHLGRTLAQERHDAGGRVIGSNFTYDGAGRVLTRETSQDASTRVTSTYDTLGRQVSQIDPNSDGTWLFGYDEVGNVVYVDDPEPSQHVQSLYDELGRVVRRCTYASDAFDPTATSTSCGTGTWESVYAYDEAFAGHGIGRLTTATDASGEESFWYDAHGRITTRARSIDGVTAETSFSFDLAGRLTSVTYPDDAVATYGYSASGQLVSISGVVDDIDYDFMGRRVTMVRSNGTTDSWDYYGSGENFRLRDLRTVVTASPSTTYLDLTHTYNSVGQVGGITDHRNPVGSPPDPLSNAATFAYDSIGRIDQVTGSSYDNDFDFDGLGNLTVKDGKALTYGVTAGPHQADSFGAATLSYTANGNRKVKSEPGVEVESYTYDALDQLVRIDIDSVAIGSHFVTFAYDYAGRRISRLQNGHHQIRYFSRFVESQGGTLTKHIWAGDLLIATDHADVQLAGGSLGPRLEIPPSFWVGLGLVVCVLLLGAGLQLTPLPAHHVLASRALGVVLLLLATGPPVLLLPRSAVAGGGGGGPPAPYVGMRHYHVDRLGSTQVVTDETGAVLQQLRYDAWGAIRARLDGSGADLSDPLAHPSDDARRTFTGYEHENLSGLQYAGARFYDPELGQFLTHDPAAQFPSPYAYGPGDPLNGTDPTGASFFGLDLGTLLILASVLGGAAYTGYQAYQAGGTGAAFGAVLSTVVTAALSFGVAGTAGAAVGSAGNLLTQVATNPLVQKTVFYAYAGLAIANTLDSSPSSGLSTAATIVGLASLSLSFASATSSALANGAQPRSVSQDGGVGASQNVPTDLEQILQDLGPGARESETFDVAASTRFNADGSRSADGSGGYDAEGNYVGPRYGVIDAIPGNPFTGARAAAQAFRHLERFHGVATKAASNRLHTLKRMFGLGPADNVAIGRTGDVYNAATGQRLGTLTDKTLGGFKR